MTAKEYLIDLWKDLSGIVTKDKDNSMPLLCELARSEWSKDFENMMRYRLIMGAFRYGKMHEFGKAQYDRVGKIKSKVELYARTGNLEYLVDIANIAMMEFEEGDHPNRHFESVDYKDHTEVK